MSATDPTARQLAEQAIAALRDFRANRPNADVLARLQAAAELARKVLGEGGEMFAELESKNGGSDAR